MAHPVLRGLKIFAAVWAVLITLSFAAGALLLWQQEGFSAMLSSLAPFSLQSFMVIAFSYAPAILAYIIADVLLSRSEQ